ncbi:unnamed protein product [Mesocestoides corti]|uniref:Uncharacterized protein n=1 Tax=Mesocestoides corti TaxID=53468 RepID=A0A0R3UA69_MESCO|nr:unnamed protein product [Mesocestoides corti]
MIFYPLLSDLSMKCVVVFLKHRQLLESLRQSDQLDDEERGFEATFVNPLLKAQAASGVRRTLASLRTTETGTSMLGGEGSGVPSVRSRAAIDSNQQGLKGIDRKRVETLRQQRKHTTGLQIFQDDDIVGDLPNLPAIQSGASDFGESLSRLAKPISEWNVENLKKPVAKLNQQAALSAASTSLPPAHPVRTGETLTVYKDSQHDAREPAPDPPTPRPSSIGPRPRGLKVKKPPTSPTEPPQQSSLLFSFEALKAALLQQPSVAECLRSESDADVEFFCDVDALYSHNEETCFEMNRGLSADLASCGQTLDPGECFFSLALDDKLSKTLLSEIADITSEDTEEVVTDALRPQNEGIGYAARHSRTTAPPA